jgi:enterochelin esterase family protein
VVRIGRRTATFFPPSGAWALIGDFTDWERNPIPLDGPLTLEFPEGAYVEYAFLDREGQPFPDPDNPERADNPGGATPGPSGFRGSATRPLPSPKRSPRWRGTA